MSSRGGSNSMPGSRSSRGRGGRNPFNGPRGGLGGRMGFNPATRQPDPIPDNLGKRLETLTRSQMRQIGTEMIAINDAECVGSYNWIGSVDAPTIAIPGASPRWTPPANAQKLRQDSEQYYRDMNAAHSPAYPLQAATQAVLTSAAVKPAEIDLFACASTLRNLLQFIRGDEHTFRIMLEAVGSTVFLIRRDGAPHAFIPDVRGYGHTMPAAYTDWHPDVRGSVSNQRILHYQLGGLRCLVRYEPDGYLPEHAPDVAAAPAPRAGRADAGIVDDLVAGLGAAGVSAALAAGGGGAERAELQVRAAGVDIPQAATFELKTRAAYNGVTDQDLFDKFAMRLWLTQTPFLIAAYHDYGRFDTINVTNVRDQVSEWERANQADIRKLVWLLEWIVRRVNEEPDGTLELWRYENGSLDVLKPGTDFLGALPLELEDRWVGGADE